jgi:hypothetical protein
MQIGVLIGSRRLDKAEFWCLGEWALLVQLILYHVNLGWFSKSIHRWSLGVMVLILILHIILKIQKH